MTARRTVAALVLALAVMGTSASSGDVPRIGLLWLGTPTATRPFYEAFLRGLRAHGYAPGQDVVVEQRWANGRAQKLHELARELTRLRVAVIVTGSIAGIQAAHQATRTIPIVFATLNDPLGTGLVGSLGHPGGNATGLAIPSENLSARRIQLLKEALPGVRRAAVLWNSANRGLVPAVKDTETTARALGIRSEFHDVRRPRDLDRAFQAMSRERPDAVIVLPDALFFSLQATILEVTTKLGLPAMFSTREFVESGGLMSYGANYQELFERSAGFVDRILKGARPDQLPIERPTKFELVINLRTARALGITLPDALLQQAEVIR